MVRYFKRPGAHREQNSGLFVLLSRVFVWLVAALLAVIPWSERYSLLDNFPHGQDTEFSLLAFLLFLGLMLLLAHSRINILGALIKGRESVSALHSGCAQTWATQLSHSLEYGPGPPPGPPLAAFDIPRKI